MKVAIIGGGPSGLVTLKYLLTVHHFQPVDPIEVQLFESEDRVGGTFSYRTYDGAEVMSTLLIGANR
jgi:dimethylaniline monooxygenase (N-oxide forming)